MELKYKAVLYVCIALACLFLILYFIVKKKGKKYDGGVKIYSTERLKEHAYMRRKRAIYRVFSVIALLAILAGIVSGGLLVARLHKVEKRQEERYARDIILCLDVSTSVDYLNEKLVGELIDTVKSLKGERFGIVIFNTSPVLISPLTDDYEFIIEQLENIRKGLDARLNMDQFGTYSDDYFYWNEFISGGTLVGNEERGSSLVGDGLASTVYNFSENDEDKTKIVILTTDNDVYGDEMFDLPEAADICKKHNIVVYGVGTKEMYQKDMDEMQKAVEKTGGKFYLEEESGTFSQIVDDINSESKDLVKGKTYIIETDFPEKPFIVLLVSVIMMFVSIKILKR